MYPKFRKHMQRGAASFLLGVSLIGLAGCATMHMEGVDKVFYEEHDPLNPGAGNFIIQKNNDLYLRSQGGADILFRTTYTDKQLTNSADVEETDVRVWDNGEMTYFAHEPDGGHWYSQPLSGDDSNRTRLDRAPGR